MLHKSSTKSADRSQKLNYQHSTLSAKRHLLALAIAAAGAFGLPRIGSAAIYYWNTTTTGPWATGASWSDNAASGGNTGTVPGSGDTAYFNQSSVNGAETVQLSGATSITGMTFANTGTTTLLSSGGAQTLSLGTSGITINSGTGAVTLGDPTNTLNLAVSGSQSWTNNSSNVLTIVNGLTSSAASGTQTLTFAGNFSFGGTISNGSTGGRIALTDSNTGTVTLSGANTYSGATSVSGTLLLANANAVQNSAVTLNNGATLQLKNNSGTSFNSSGAVALASVAAQTVTIDVGNSGSGTDNALTLANGISYAGPTGGIGAGTYTTQINITGANSYELSLPSVTFGNAGSYGSGSPRAYVLDLNPTSANITIGNVTLTGSGGRTTVALTLDGTATGNTVTSAISLPTGRPVTKAGTGSWSLSGANAYDGATSITGGTLQYTGSGSNSGGGSYALTGTGVLTLNTSGTVAASTLSIGSGTTVNLTGGTLSLTGNVTASSGAIGLFFTNGTLKNASAGAITISSSLPIYFVTGGAATIDTTGGNITSSSGFLAAGNNGSVTVQGGHTLTLPANNPMTGGITITGASSTLAFSAASTLGSLVTINAGANFDMSSYSQSVVGLAGVGTVLNTGGTASVKTLTITGTGGNTFSGVIGSGTATDAFTGLTLNLTSGMQALSGSNTFSGGVTISGGTLQLGSTGALNSTPGSENAVTFGAATTGALNLNGNSVVIANLNGPAAGPIVQNANASTAATLTIGNSTNGAGTYAGILQDGAGSAALSVIKAGSSTLTLLGLDTYSGTTNINSGTLAINTVNISTNAQALGAGSAVNLGVAATSSGTLLFTGTSGTLDKNINALGNGSNIVWNNGGGTLTLSGTLAKNGTTLVLQNTNAGSNIIVSQPITGPSAHSDLIITGGTTTLNAVSTYVGPTTVNGGGTLVLGISGAIPSNSDLALGDATTTGTLAMGGYTNAIGSLAFGAGGGTVALAANQTGSAQLAASGMVALGSGNTLDLTGMSNTAGLYKLISGNSLSGSFSTVTGLDGNYLLRYGTVNANELDAQHKATISTITATPAAGAIIAGTSTAFTFTVANSAPTNSASLAFGAAAGTNTTGSVAGPVSVAPSATSGDQSGLTFTGSTVGASQTGSFSVTDSNATNSPQTGSVSVDVYDHANLSATVSGLVATLTNPQGGSLLRASANIESIALAVDPTYNTPVGWMAATTLTQIDPNQTPTVASLPATLLSGTYHAKLSLAAHDVTLAGGTIGGAPTGNLDAQISSQPISAPLNNTSGTGTTTFNGTMSVANFGLTDSKLIPTTATLENGTLSGTLRTDHTVAMSFTAADQPFLLSDKVSITGLGGNLTDSEYVLEMTFDTAGRTYTASPFLGQETSAGIWTSAVSQNTTSTSTHFYADTAWTGQTTLGDYGFVFTNVGRTQGLAWAVLDHDGTFAVIPEPTSLGLLGLGALGLLVRRNRKSRAGLSPAP